MMSKAISHLFLVILVLSLIPISLSAQCDRERDSLVLIDILKANPQITATNWGDLNKSIDTWQGVTTNLAGCILGLRLAGENLEALPESIGDLEQLRNLNINNNNIYDLPESIGRLTSLLTLSITNNNLANLPESIGGLSSLRELYLVNNSLEVLPESFGSLSSLNILRLTDNNLTNLPESFGSLSSLQELHLDRNSLEVLPESFGSLSSLVTLSIWDNRLTNLPESIGGLSSLVTLSIGDNRLTNLPESFGSLSSLVTLSIWDNRLTNLPESIGGLSSLQELHLDRNSLEVLPESFGSLSSLNVLRLTDNNLTNLPESFGSLSSLQELHLDRNSLEVLPESFGSLSSLNVLRLTDNNLTNLPESFGSLSSLVTLSIWDNRLTNLPESIGGLSSLQTFYIDRNSLEVLPESFWGLSSLVTLDIGDNRLTNLPESIGNLSSLRGLYLEGNSLQVLPESIGSLDSLEYLDISENSLEVLPESFGSLSSLNVLRLTDNNLTNLPESFWGLSSLVTLSIGDNRLTNLPESIGNLSSLRELYLEGNSLQVLPEAISDLTALYLLYINGNQLTFSSLKNLPLDLFIYSPQAPIFKDTVYYFRKGAEAQIDLGIDEDVDNNIYQWFKDSTVFTPDPVNSMNSNILIFPDIQLSDKGIYYTNVTNSNFPDLTLESFPIKLRVCDPSFDSLQLVLMFESTGGQNWNNNTNWLTTEPIRNWYGITTNTQGCVNKIVLSGNGLTGELPIMELESLDTLIIDDNLLRGIIPVDMVFPSIEYLDLSGNAFSGVIPDVISTWMELSNLIIDNNQFREAIPPEVGDLCELEELNLSFNDFKGELPIELTELFNLKFGSVDFSYNDFDSLKSKIIFFCPYGLDIMEGNPAYPDFVEICTRTCNRSEFQDLMDHAWLVDSLNEINCDNVNCVGNEVIAESGFVNVRGVEVFYIRSGCYTNNNEYRQTITLYDCEGNVLDITFCDSNIGPCPPFSVTSEEQFADLIYDIRWSCACNSAFCIERDTISIEPGQNDTIEIGELLQNGLFCDSGMYSLSSVNSELPGDPPYVTEGNIGFTYELITENLISNEQCTTTIAVVRGATGRDEYIPDQTAGPFLIACHPSPVEDFLLCPEIDMSSVDEYRVFNLHGMEMPKYAEQFQDKMQLNVQQYPSGIYFLLVKTKDRQYLNRFTVIR